MKDERKGSELEFKSKQPEPPGRGLFNVWSLVSPAKPMDGLLRKLCTLLNQNALYELGSAIPSAMLFS